MLVGFRERDKDVNRRGRRWEEKKKSEPGEYVFGIVKGS